MKLWQKIVLICGAVLIVTVSLCSLVLLNQTRENVLSSTCQQAADKLDSLKASFTEMVDYYALGSDSAAVKRTLVKYCFTQFADSDSVLVIDGETVYSVSDIRPEVYLIIDGDEQQQFTGEIQGRQYLIVGKKTWLSTMYESECLIFVVQDITGVHENLLRIMRQYLAISALFALLGLGGITALVLRSMRPLNELQKAASDIAQGNYQHRADVKSRDEVGALAVSFNQMAQSVQRHVEELTETAERQRLFIAGVTHEFKTPMAAIVLNADTLQSTCLSEEEQMDALAQIQRQTQWLERLVQKLLKLLTLEQKIDMQTVSVPELLARVEASTRETLQTRGVALEIDCQSQTLYGDMDLLQSALVNLVDNASKASASGQKVILLARENVLEVTDSGTGIPKEAISRLTEPFYMVDKSRSKKQGGTGLGLALAEKIVQAHGAALEFDSELGRGTTVRIAFPYGKSNLQRTCSR